MREVLTKNELKKALFRNEERIHVASEKLGIGLVTRPHKFRLIRYIMLVNGYRLISRKRLGMLDVQFVKERHI